MGASIQTNKGVLDSVYFISKCFHYKLIVSGIGKLPSNKYYSFPKAFELRVSSCQSSLKPISVNLFHCKFSNLGSSFLVGMLHFGEMYFGLPS